MDRVDPENMPCGGGMPNVRDKMKSMQFSDMKVNS